MDKKIRDAVDEFGRLGIDEMKKRDPTRFEEFDDAIAAKDSELVDRIAAKLAAEMRQGATRDDER
ncbi:hypothetical protein [Mycoplana dimorpha]|uniref:Uncharacterized protein n=1 Tax=Mycoplana dimorpha TaxID=28320 RepID=A0A2T5ANR2_MYCDI|nr:hypothetical protein [Mycoplana dimorpha]PTM88372.1 hypothetical protein C7449_1124 [Mycoplana dimorpha]